MRLAGVIGRPVGYGTVMSVGTDKDLITTLKRVAAVFKGAEIPFAIPLQEAEKSYDHDYNRNCQ